MWSNKEEQNSKVGAHTGRKQFITHEQPLEARILTADKTPAMSEVWLRPRKLNELSRKAPAFFEGV